jgi:putative ABC transport system substrate-binding protein
MRRRVFITLIGGAAAWPLAVRAQQPASIRRIGILMAHPETDPEFQDYAGAFREGLQKLGWIEGRNIRFDFRWGALDDAEMRSRSAKELIALQPDLHRIRLHRRQCFSKLIPFQLFLLSSQIRLAAIS